MKKWFIVGAVILILLLTIGGLVIGIFAQKNYSQKQLDELKTAVSYEEYRTEVDKLVAEFRKALEASEGENKELSLSYLKLLDELSAKSGVIEDLEAERNATILLLKDSLNAQITAYEAEITSLNAQIVDIEANITDLTALPGDNTEQIATLEKTKALLQSNITKYTATIERIRQQLADLDAVQ